MHDKMGRKGLFNNQENQKIALTLARNGATNTEIADFFSITNQRLGQVFKEMPEFKTRLHRARYRITRLAIKCIQSKFKNDWRSAAWYLERIDPEKWGNCRVGYVNIRLLSKSLKSLGEKLAAVLPLDVTEKVMLVIDKFQEELSRYTADLDARDSSE